MSQIKQIQKEIESLQSKINELRVQKKNLENMPIDKKVATELHRVFCKVNHTDGCGWYYDQGDWNQYSRRDYLKKAQSLLKLMSESEIYDILNKFNEVGLIV